MNPSDFGYEFSTWVSNRKTKGTRQEDELLSSHPEWSPKGLRDRLLARRNASRDHGSGARA
jgi:hypothetical protein